MAGGDLSLAMSFGRWTLADVRVGGRLLDGGRLPSGRLTARAGTASLGAGLHLGSKRRAGFALMLRLQGYAVQYDAELDGGGSRTALLGAAVVAVEPRLLVAITHRISIAAGGAAGVPLHGIVVRTQGVETESLSGFVLSANLGFVVAL